MSYGKRLLRAMQSASDRGILGAAPRAWRRELVDQLKSRFDLEITVQAVGAVTRDEYEFKAEKNSYVAAVLGVRSDWLINEQGPMLLSDDERTSMMLKKADSDPLNRASFNPNESLGHTRKFKDSGSSSPLIPVTPQPPHVVDAVSWEQLMDVLEEGFDALEAGLWVKIGDDANAPEMEPGDLAFFKRGPVPKAGSRVLVREAGGDILVREYRVITSKVFEAVPVNKSYGTLRSDINGLEVLAVRLRYMKED